MMGRMMTTMMTNMKKDDEEGDDDDDNDDSDHPRKVWSATAFWSKADDSDQLPTETKKRGDYKIFILNQKKRNF